MTVKTKAYVNPMEAEEAERLGRITGDPIEPPPHKEARLVLLLDEVYAYQESIDPDMPGTLLYMRSGDRPTVVMTFEEFDRKYQKWLRAGYSSHLN